ncbi:DUF4397 domain-containing protein [Salipaludibacillus aurantiacus]|uniref:DUF4397 domain-containing protein n=1 Tax=Salipaludibacillus aurantiacus TaxID=1601833 RepID=A0A1H9RLP0_9BACI|nr:DUF4397 domain-containing protein [Salipaludibacillus aurantiacus]SER73686.1 protein of unknown function [Salipaludibacillus aurantiacus]
MKKRKVMLRIVTILFVLVTFTKMVSADGMENAMVRIVHASPDAPAVDIAVNGDVVVENLDFKTPTDYLELPEGTHTVEIFPAGDLETAVLTKDLSVEGGQAYTVAAIDRLENLQLKVIEDETAATEGMTWVRAGHLSPDAPSVDITANGEVLFASASFPSVTDYAEVSPMTADLEVRVAGTEDAVLELPQTQLEADTLYTVLAVGLVEGEPGLDAIVLADPSMDRMPSEMPATGMGGASSYSDNSTVLGGFLMILIALGSIFLLFRQPWQTEN